MPLPAEAACRRFRPGLHHQPADQCRCCRRVNKQALVIVDRPLAVSCRSRGAPTRQPEKPAFCSFRSRGRREHAVRRSSMWCWVSILPAHAMIRCCHCINIRLQVHTEVHSNLSVRYRVHCSLQHGGRVSEVLEANRKTALPAVQS